MNRQLKKLALREVGLDNETRERIFEYIRRQFFF